jgi:hypothetical protein
MHHVPHTGDLPNTVFTTAQSSVFISPHNYLLSDPSRSTSQQVQINFDGDNVAVSTFGSTLPSCTKPDLVSVKKKNSKNQFLLSFIRPEVRFLTDALARS